MKVNFFPKAVKGLTSFQIVILKEKKNILLFFMIGRQAKGDEVSWRWR